MLVVGAIGMVLSLVVGGLGVVAAVLASHRAQAAADLGALAAASVLVEGEPPAVACALASSVAGRGGAAVASCRTGADLSVEIVVRVPATVSWVGAATARSRAGPGPDPG